MKDNYMKKGVSVVIPCYNSGKRLPATLLHIAQQNVPRSIPWEVILINNGSQDNTTEVAWNEWKKHGVKIPFNVFEQNIPGSSAAREMGINKANYEYILFVDDDNWLNDDYIKNAYTIMKENPEIGMLGGEGVPHCESPPPDWFNKYHYYYALGPQGERSGDITQTRGYVYTAGAVLRKSAWEYVKKCGFEHCLPGRKGELLFASEDVEMCYALRLANYKIWFDDRLRFTHYMPNNRLDWQYFLNLTESIHLAKIYLTPYVDILMDIERKRIHNQYLWIIMSSQNFWKIIKYYKSYIRYLLWGEYHDWVHRKYKMHLGELKGWLALRSNYLTIYDRVDRLKHKLVH